ncbi:hypothetical protein A3B05_01675 [Candidatus Giovannonibacteria bacterium RIFCSPLOWO2_01_FULL_43_160]|uniref:UDP-glucose 4-epimerase n=2 Tax=Candidatus Giovannoniibacteriota TaxID=1752738 RepID=A0A0G1IVK7_9BACT|nr:MAG: UDP-glucose 4-epimerase [Candidatus Giovannonibacteria bacterium GW2011_GWB1_43_13]KKS99567.1 MAG: UDP-glucose 4-epimerase [Candidatus Giovannonibacteria bacterium GW2011_GWA1_43_15]KKT21644.1 MAG: UDP-glucose 4-epimerase [Candidatus Giovannonibacteria bacterium GW2011_GWC2_43_8]KKT63446.1 MAG: UDP-glucose 4-epimerase [Candidatus Giovannonibacteria bacterium GW2011_GWA2_44_26]OGF58221.1 MAG: hypothetical protein A2652_03375 [Candidatus Giovannonibacteria bacterium RIFCSPHIGHO2_01_FULL_4
MKILLFGGAGFIGEYLAKNLAGRDGCELKIIDRYSKERGKDLDVEMIVVLTQPGSPVSDILIPAITASKKLKKIVYLSTLLIYPDSSEKQDENIQPDPKTEYERNKYQEELMLEKAAKKIGCQLCIARLSNVYGDVKNRGIINYIILSAIKGNLLTVYGDKDKKIRDYIFIEDAANLLEFLIFYKQQNLKEIFNICTGSAYSIQELIDMAERVTGRKINFEKGAPTLEKLINIGDNQKILALSHYKLKYNLAHGLKKTYKNYLRTV